MSREFGSREVKEMIKRQKEKYGWEFLFLAANIDAVTTAETFGIGRDRAVNYNLKRGTKMMYEDLDLTLREFRQSGGIREGWAKTFEDHQSEAITPKTAQTPDKKD